MALLFVLRSAPAAVDAPAALPAPRVATPPVFHEAVDGQTYANADLGFRLRAPENWTLVLGARPRDGTPYEGLVVKMSPPAGNDGDALRPFVSVVKRSLPAGASDDPLDFLRRESADARRTLLSGPSIVVVSGRKAARVSFESGTLRAIQVVRVTPGGALIVTAAAPPSRFPALASTFEDILASLRFES
ncbi:MAG TPA: hypothetical protein VF950_19555 [Planctomycetota bacterium]